MNTSQEIAARIKMRAQDKGIKLGTMLSDIGVSDSTLQNMKRCMPSIETLIKFAVYLECSLDDLCGTEGIKNNAAPDQSVRNDVIKMINSLPASQLERILGYLEGLGAHSE